MRTVIPAVVLTVVLLAGCGGDDDASSTPKPGAKPTAPEPTKTIRIAEFLYKPESAALRIGQKVAVVNEDETPHTVTDKTEKRTFDSGTIKGKSSGSVTFSKAGTFTYFCDFHPTMRGSVTVLK